MRRKKRGCGCLVLFIPILILALIIAFYYYQGMKVNIDTLQDINNEETFVAVNDMPDYVKNAFIAVEDKRFYKHDGVDWFGTGRAIVISWKNGEATQGGSTITQQLAKNYYFNNEKSISRKFKEIVVAKRIENNYTKDEIMSYYLSSIYFGDNIYNVEEAANTYFGTTTHMNGYLPQITLLQSAILASTINAPSNYDVENFSTDTALKTRTKNTLSKMLDQKLITEAQYNEAAAGIPLN
ncbi:glycosyltransferase [Macrococcus lamae]|uniref:peptidoglycan glycosyltransferase n=1 Tax=Macrococcus lamae TaxID=198484 RepID=A0A4R6BSB0_9STAP|nr:glycosyltransferase [Macrococcus lamae]TDM05301.1 glycosyltransferase [Macrococcus lamae]